MTIYVLVESGYDEIYSEGIYDVFVGAFTNKDLAKKEARKIFEKELEEDKNQTYNYREYEEDDDCISWKYDYGNTELSIVEYELDSGQW